MYVIGTAGHVDHGKSTLIHALTGIDPDRLQQEKDRGITIELGFAWINLPGDREVSIVDVPGHERLVKHMLMGAGGIDLALLIIAADEGVMPQTREHIAILDLLQVQRGIVVITKKDLADREWMDLVEADVEDTLRGTTLEGSPLAETSVVTGEGLDELLAMLMESLDGLPMRADVGRPRLAVDRSFTMAGFGAVVTGTLIDGVFRTGQEVELQPSGYRARIRGLQTHRKAVEEAPPGTRVAVNLSGVNYQEITRGDVLTVPGWLRPTAAIDVSLHLITDAPRPLKHNGQVAVYTGASETQARVRLLETDSVEPGDHAWAQIRLDSAVPVVKGDHYIIRDTETTLGGGTIVEPHAKRHRRFHKPTITRLEALARGSEAEALSGALESVEPATVSELARAANMSDSEVNRIIKNMRSEGTVVQLDSGSGLLYSAAGWDKLQHRATEAVTQYHKRFPLRAGMPTAELRDRLRLDQAGFTQVLNRLNADGVLETTVSLVRMPQHRPKLSLVQEREAAQYLERLRETPYSPPSDAEVDPEVLQLLIDRGDVIRTPGGIVFLNSAYDEIEKWVIERVQSSGPVSISDVRDAFGTNRRSSLAALEQMDRTGVTRRVGDDRVLR